MKRKAMPRARRVAPRGLDVVELHRLATRAHILIIILLHSFQAPLVNAQQRRQQQEDQQHGHPEEAAAAATQLLPSGCGCDYGTAPGAWLPNKPAPPGSNSSGLHRLHWETLDPGCPMQDMLQRMAATFTGAISPLFPQDSASTTAALPWEAGVEEAAKAASAAEAQARQDKHSARRQVLEAGATGAAAGAGSGSAGSGGTDGSSPPRQLNMLIFSDSVGERTMRAWCRYVQNSSDARINQPDYHFPFDQPARKSLRHCRTSSGLSIWHYFNIGVDRMGPWFEDAEDSWQRRLELMQAMLQQRLGEPPDIVVVASAMWDVARLQWLDAKPGQEDRVDKTFADSYLMLEPQRVQAYSNDMARLMAGLQAAYPQALLMTYTTAVVRHDQYNRALAKPLGRAAYVAQLNAALRQLAAQRSVPLVDYERLAAGLGFDQYLSDNTHPNDAFMLQAINLFLNVYEQRRRCWALPARTDLRLPS